MHLMSKFSSMLGMLTVLTFPAVSVELQFGSLNPDPINVKQSLTDASAELKPSGPTSPYQAFLLADAEIKSYRDGRLSTSNPDESVVISRNQGQISLQNITLFKEGICTHQEESSSTGLNAALLADNGIIQLTNGSITTQAEGAHAVVATGGHSKIRLEHTVLKTTEDFSHGLHATYGGSIIARDLVIETQGEHCAALSTDRGEGTVELTTAALSTYGTHSPLIYSSGLIKIAEVRGFSNGSEIAVIDGKNAILLERCELTGRVKNGIMLYQSFPDDPSDGGMASFSARESRLTNLSDGYMFYITNTRAQIYLERTQLQNNSDNLIYAAADLFGHEGRNGGELTLNTRSQHLSGEISADSLSTLTLNFGEHSSFQGSINRQHTARAVHVNLAADATWTLQGPSCVNTIADADPNFTNIMSNGFNISYKSSECPQLGGQTFMLPGGGRLEPEFED